MFRHSLLGETGALRYRIYIYIYFFYINVGTKWITFMFPADWETICTIRITPVGQDAHQIPSAGLRHPGKLALECGSTCHGMPGGQSVPINTNRVRSRPYLCVCESPYAVRSALDALAALLFTEAVPAFVRLLDKVDCCCRRYRGLWSTQSGLCTAWCLRPFAIARWGD